MSHVRPQCVAYAWNQCYSQLNVVAIYTKNNETFEPVWPLLDDVATIDENCDIEVEELNLVARKSRKSVDYCKKKV